MKILRMPIAAEFRRVAYLATSSSVRVDGGLLYLNFILKSIGGSKLFQVTIILLGVGVAEPVLIRFTVGNVTQPFKRLFRME